MCGISAIIGSENPDEVRESLSHITHRGFILYEIAAVQGATLGANRLPIVGREHGQQPARNEDGTILAVMNGEIYNHNILREELRNKGHRFQSESDTEILVHLYEEHGSDFAQQLDSEQFAFVVYNAVSGEFVAGRDRIGVKPLYVAKDSAQRLHFASELKQLSGNSRIDSIEEVSPGTIHTNDGIQTYWRAPRRQWTNRQTAVEQLDERIIAAVKKQVDTDLPVGVFLSGGIDSSLITKLANDFHPDVTAIIMGNERTADYQAAVPWCQEMNYKYVVVPPRHELHRMQELIYTTESVSPKVVRAAFHNDIISKAARELGLRIVLAGEGADEMFGGYNEFSQLSVPEVAVGSDLTTCDLAPGHMRRIDRNAMRYTVEVRLPYLDPQVVEFGLTLPPEHLAFDANGKRETKAILREVAERHIPHDCSSYKTPL